MTATSSESPSRLVKWATLVGGLAALATMVGFVLHGCGHVADTTNLRQWGINDGLFERNADWKVVNGYYAVVFQGLGVLKAIPWHAALAAFLMLALGFFMMRIPSRKPPEWISSLQRLPLWLRMVGTALGQSFFTVYLAGMLFIFGLLLVSIPGLVGEKAGKEQAAEERAKIEAMPEDQWQELWRQDQRVARGKIVTSSPTRYAIYDRDFNEVRILPSDNIEIRVPQQKATPVQHEKKPPAAGRE
ncbi:hypothetical protein [Xanthomonas euvesicatoria]|uniref:hypothetical protein n=1 Tax=Xanthomonas euvesicatoria TaxID=456327 RepID=UPI001183D7C3|nr:hypothetical protein [Xanthomonas euvesicatoria]QTK46645.1 hypothetical protein XeaCFBP3836p_15750 [Xanthomonas euvesicatoria pv. alfalfae]